jgi:hypothetical protein
MRTGSWPATERFIQEIREEFPKFRIVAKRDDRLSRAIHWVLLILTVGGQRDYLSHYHTVLGWTLYTPDSWESTPDLDRVITLRHERVHLRQRRRLGFPLMAFLYLIPFFPLGLAYGRARLEWEAYEETLRATAELKGLAAACDPSLKEHLIARFTGPDYGWMWPFRRAVSRWIDAALDRIRAEGTR